MPLHLIFFLGVLSFLSGVIFSSLGLPFLLSLLPAIILFAALVGSKVKIKIALLASLLLIGGSFYYVQDDYRYQSQIIHLPKPAELSGVIVADPRVELDAQSFYFETSSGKILIKTGLYPAYVYGDALVVEGEIKVPPQNDYGRYLAVEHVAGTMDNPTISRVASGKGNPILAFLFRLKNSTKDSFRRLLSHEEAALLSGITMGANENISKQFLQKLSLSGVRHITAINGLHMTIIIFMVFGACTYFLPRRYAFLTTFVLVLFFTALTGFSVSAIRAALMAFVAVLAQEAGRLYSPRNALALAGLVLALANPKVLVFDIGFQLSFLAVLSIIYFMPVLRRVLRISDAPGFAHIKQSLLITVSVQLMTAPILITQFQNFSLTVFITNILILLALPYVMFAGFILALFSFLFYPLAFLFSFVVAPLIEYVIAVVNVMSRLAILFNPDLGPIGITIYYGILIFLIYRFYKPKSVGILS